MRHNIAKRKLNRKTSHRISLLKNLSKSLLVNEQIKTTLPKAKDLRPYVEKILTFGKKNSIHSKRKVFSILRDNNIVTKVFDVLAKRYSNRDGGYVRVLKAGFRSGDSSPMAIVELVDRDLNAKGLIDRQRKILEDKNKDNLVENKVEKEVAVPPPEIKNDSIQEKTSEKETPKKEK
ncbi:MAG: 50S ribosomal protein L17 [Alphaproteobacteria bacterium MarineAlpha8_Bin1]|nr:MAG: 50S ribosomal protein L17 [Alphaproteobacteria bacterium MarineAlpha8_Bin1]|tara:strand:+ start:353 stop:883 length:531 start_codon:yes stop_codon:yes gene_type:complete